MMISTSDQISLERFLPYPQALKENIPLNLSKKTARIIKSLYDSGVLMPKTWGVLLDLEEEIENA